KTLAQYVKFQHDMLERVLKGSVDPIALMNAQRPLIGQKANPYLRLISGGETVTISTCKGGKNANIYHAKKTFPGYIDPDFNNCGINLPQPATEKTDVDVYEMYNKNADFRTLFGSLSSDLKSLAFESQEQIETFCKENKQWLRTDGYGTFFLFTEEVDGEEKFFIADVGFSSGGLMVYVFHLSSDRVWAASAAHRIVVPATKTSDTQN
ncbi:MAG: hypothetical protein LRY41_00280, partial [Candidatus Pacebacteria bacterium]|nr:hypothetical protein [Candidatus Paceibacterota bacterium]